MSMQTINTTIVDAQLAMLTEQRNLAQNQNVILAGKIAELQEIVRELTEQQSVTNELIEALQTKLKGYEPDDQTLVEVTEESFTEMLQNAETIPAAEATK